MDNYYRRTNSRLRNRTPNRAPTNFLMPALGIACFIMTAHIFSDSIFRPDRIAHFSVCLGLTLFLGKLMGPGRSLFLFLVISTIGIAKELSDHQGEMMDLVANYSGWALALALLLSLSALSKTSKKATPNTLSIY